MANNFIRASKAEMIIDQLSAELAKMLRREGIESITIQTLRQDLERHLDENMNALLNVDTAVDNGGEGCPGCGCLPGDGYTETCFHPEGCGFYRAELAGNGFAS